MISTDSSNKCSHLHASPNTFAGLMDLYERNYIAMRQLIPIMPPVEAQRSSYVDAGLTLHLHVLERSRYTSVVVLTYHFHQPQGVLLEPNLQIRIYHDAQSVEVIAGSLRPRSSLHSKHRFSELRTRWQINLFLYKWLHYCLHQGHRFSETTCDSTVKMPRIR